MSACLLAALIQACNCSAEPRIYSKVLDDRHFRSLRGEIFVVLSDPRGQRRLSIIKGELREVDKIPESLAYVPKVGDWGPTKPPAQQEIVLYGMRVKSPNGDVSAAPCYYVGEKKPVPYDVALISVETGRVLAKTRRPRKRRIVGVAWAPNGEYLALLTDEQKMGLLPHELFAAFAGHPAAHNNFYLEILSPSLVDIVQAKLANGFVHGSGAIGWQ